MIRNSLFSHSVPITIGIEAESHTILKTNYCDGTLNQVQGDHTSLLSILDI